MAYQFIQKQILIGSSASGKSSLLIRLTDDRFLNDSEPTIGVEFGGRLCTLEDGKIVKLQIWDTAGQERFKTITRSYYRGATGAILVFDLTHRPAFLACEEWLADLRQYGDEEIEVLLVGNKSDLVNARATTVEEAEAFVLKEGLIGYIEASALNGDNVQAAFDTLTRAAHKTAQLALAKNRPTKSNLPLVLGGSGSSTGGCC